MAHCPECDAEIADGQKFCMECGRRLERRCPTCDTTVTESARFCGECGTSLEGDEPGRARDEGAIPERRLVTVLFADLVGYSSMSENRDPEEVRDFLSRYFARVRDTIERYGGTVDKFIGDAVMGVWGTPIAHEDDAERAVRAALDLTDDVAALAAQPDSPDISVRVGVATGEAAVFLNTPAGEGMAGDLVNTASRLEGAARPGTVLVNAGTHRAARLAVSFEDMGELTLKGKNQSVRAWRPMQVIARVGGQGRSTALEPPFVGRERELQTLRDIHRRVTQEGRAHLVSVMGVAGLGKSRLVDELEKYLDGLVGSTFWHRGRSPSYGDGVTFWALGEMVRTRAKIVDSDDDETQREKLSAVVAEFVRPGDREWVTGALEMLLGLRPPGSLSAGEAESAWRAFFQAIAERAPTVLVFDDLHWADAGLIDFIESMLGWSRRHPILIVTLARPELLERRPTWGAGLGGFTGLAPDPLDDAEVGQMLAGLAPGLPSELERALIERAEGVPLYVVETVRMLLDDGVIDRDGRRLTDDPVELSMPESLHALVAARLDSLGVDDRRLIQHAAVLGQSFDKGVLAEIHGIDPTELDERLERLVTRQLLAVDDDPRSVERGFFMFVQGVIREVALGTIGRSERRALHLAIADRYESMDDIELLPVVVHHLTQARRLGRGDEADELGARAFDLLTRAATRAGSLGSHDQEASFLDQAIELAPDEEARVRLRLELGRAAHSAGQAERALDAWRAAHEGAAQSGAAMEEAAAAAGLADALLMASRVDEAKELLEAAVSRAETADLPAARRAELLSQSARAAAFADDPASGLEVSERALALAGPAGAVDVVANSLLTRAWGLFVTDRRDEALAITEGALRLAVRNDLTGAEFRARNNLGSFLWWRDPAYVMELTQEGIQRALRRGETEQAVLLLAKAVTAAASSGDWPLARELLEGSEWEGASRFARSQLDLEQAVLCAVAGDHWRADELLDRWRPDRDASGTSQERWFFHKKAGEIYAARGEFAGSLEHMRACAEIVPDVAAPHLGLAGTRAADLDAMSAAVAILESITRLSRRGQHWMTAIRAAREVMAGRPEAVDDLLEVLGLFEKDEFLWDAAVWSGELALLLPVTDPRREELIADALEIHRAKGAPALVEVLESRVAAS